MRERGCQEPDEPETQPAPPPPRQRSQQANQHRNHHQRRQGEDDDLALSFGDAAMDQVYAIQLREGNPMIVAITSRTTSLTIDGEKQF